MKRWVDGKRRQREGEHSGISKGHLVGYVLKNVKHI